MATEQLSFPVEPEKPQFDAEAVARHIGEHAPANPYASDEQRRQDIAERKTATHTPDTLPDHLRGTMELAEEHFRKTAPGTPEPTVEESIREARRAVEAARQGKEAKPVTNSAKNGVPKYIQNREEVLGS